jgi:hypothetical protein
VYYGSLEVVGESLGNDYKTMTERSTRQQQRYNPSTIIAPESFLVDVVPEVHYIVVPRTTNICDECYAVLFIHETQNICCIIGYGIINFIFTTYIHTYISIFIILCYIFQE